MTRPRGAPVWIVRMWSIRGRGAYVHRDAWIMLSEIEDGRLTTKQRDARRFYDRRLAERHAEAFGGRVVRLKERAVAAERAGR